MRALEGDSGCGCQATVSGLRAGARGGRFGSHLVAPDTVLPAGVLLEQQREADGPARPPTPALRRRVTSAAARAPVGT
jgi:hypothetical protein